jgi:hypothetical protein
MTNTHCSARNCLRDRACPEVAKGLFSDIRTLTSYLCFESWGALMTFMLHSFEPAPPQLETE